MKLFYGLIWTLFHVCWMLEHPKLVISPRGGSATIHCKYRRGDEEAVKYWCKEERFRFCSRNRTIRTTGSEEEVKQNGMSIKDNRVLREFSVVMENLTHNDAGAYLCGVERKYDIWQPVELIITADDVSTPTSRNKECKTVEPSESPLSPERNQPRSLDFQILLILKIPIFLTMLAAIVWVHIWYRREKHSGVQISETEGAKG
ncbi:CMRF35-like molecule 7 [Crotalus tigris]|uniref:CMRF35-like molecule 7 n=1 Tax=Crotalus tigris TaxID=88082 RepID=UPI00192F5F3C|nr:CMRF35-like molecule 7 [Crotalus tigris]XP_039198799.1 CMRF35-like molecule 7 [Crotalus tigris]